MNTTDTTNNTTVPMLVQGTMAAMDCIRWVLDEAKWPVTPADLVQPVRIEPTYAVGKRRPDGFRITVAGAIVVTANIPNHTADIVLDGKPVHPDDRSYRTGLYADAIAHLHCMGVLPSRDSRFIMVGR
ncbi:hypothetical protein ACERK3_11775 [Phycisphaerales bacterium AB-hyl4]|uniref:Uncharacterized protein n=1 Tax=Natronomicrosphaera hydrolytica TaxID=3242702 RepID=A0ABV4U826_9BACT